ncbi:hypothetical protein H6G80_33700 [Nostoc sp. FACHB-87]|uniref:hypothetical protein n=1 Tax=Nostocales TaxID=1161 RepID=UPI0016860F44|nr:MULTISPECIES: hypothetical protein [Nostocales]MBD2303388.1 hypothetical protein [Nostoc sp. FACHB-190]MBD2458993.1 hypothetical protein [Nostoc sp. FACHB-87]MBD2480004.1 hypothetical protein [Anabaena sp. FACHB-83]MBD2492130.1 hypothetical protein [Aulosira sp. FACHB-615]
MFIPFVLAQSSGQQPGQNTGVTISGDVVKGAEDGARLALNAFKQDWVDFAAGQSPVYLAIVAVSMLIAVVLVAFWSLGWYRQISDEGFSTNVVSEMVFPLLVILMLSNNGAMTTTLAVGLNNTTIHLNSKILSITKNGVTLRNAIRIVNADQSFVLAAQTKIASCDTLPTSKIDAQQNTTNPRQECIDRETKKAEEQAIKIRQQRGLNGSAGSVRWNPLDATGEIVNNAIQGVVFVILSGLSLGFAYIVQLSFLLVAHVAPIFLVLSLLPVGAKPIYAWLAGWLGLTLVLVSNSIIVGIVASSIVNVPSTNPLLTQLVQAVFSPLLAVAIGIGGGMSVFTAFTNGLNFSVSLLARR